MSEETHTAEYKYKRILQTCLTEGVKKKQQDPEFKNLQPTAQSH